jgi:hypothetical protein
MRWWFLEGTHSNFVLSDFNIGCQGKAKQSKHFEITKQNAQDIWSEKEEWTMTSLMNLKTAKEDS